MRTIVVLNGPPGCGKDTIANYLDGYKHLRFKTPLVKMAQTLSGITPKNWETRYNDRTIKNSFWDELRIRGKAATPRKYLIYLAERVLKPAYGKNIFGDIARSTIEALPKKQDIVFSDCGFKEEIEPLCSLPDILLILVNIFREGCKFSTDSRNYLDTQGVHKITLHNNGSIEATVEELVNKIKDIQGAV